MFSFAGKHLEKELNPPNNPSNSQVNAEGISTVKGHKQTEPRAFQPEKSSSF